MTVLFLKYVPRKYKLESHSFSHSGTQHILTGTTRGKGTGAQHAWISTGSPPLHTHPPRTTIPPPVHWVCPLSSPWLCKMPLGIQVLSTGKLTAWSRDFMVFIFLIQIKNPLMDYFSLIYSNTL